MKRSVILMSGLGLCVLVWLVPNGTPLKAVEFGPLKFEAPKIAFNKYYVTMALVIICSLLVVSYFQSWANRRVTKIPVEVKTRVRAGWEGSSDRFETNSVMWRHRANMLTIIVTDFTPALLIFIVTAFMLWQHVLGGKHV